MTPGIGVEGRRAAGELRSAAESATDRLREIIGSRALAMANRRLRMGLVGILWPPVAMVAVLVLLYLLDVV